MNGRIATLGASLTILLLAAAPAEARQDEQEWLRNCQRQAERSDRAVACQVKSATTTLAAGRLHVDAGRNGGISVRGGATPAVQVSARVQAQAATTERARQLADAVRIHAANGRVHADGLRTESGESWNVSFYITTPERADLDLQAVNGPLSVRDVAGHIRATTTNGPLALDNVAGDVRVRADNGPLSVRLTGSRWDGAGLDAETRNGPVTLTIPDGFAASLEVGTVNGPVSSDIPLTVTGSQRRGGRVHAAIGGGGAPVRVVTTNGPASIRRR
jgi:DUF4097 and DUF4098 domain-containing protein YvlB